MYPHEQSMWCLEHRRSLDSRSLRHWIGLVCVCVALKCSEPYNSTLQYKKSVCTVTVGSTASVGGLLHTDMMLQNYTRNTCIIDAKCIPMNSLCGAWSTGAHWTPEVCATKLGWYSCVCPWCVANHTVLPCNIYEKSCFVDIYLKIFLFKCQPKHTNLAGAEFYSLLCRKF